MSGKLAFVLSMIIFGAVGVLRSLFLYPQVKLPFG